MQKATRIICFRIFILVVCLGITVGIGYRIYQVYLLKKGIVTINSDPVRPVEVLKLQRQDRKVVGMFRGVIKPVRDATVSSKVSGTIEKISVVEGQYVKRGEKILHIDDELLRYSLDMAKANYAKAKVRYDDAIRNEKKQKRLSENRIISEDDLIKAQVDVKIAYNEMLILEADMKIKQKNMNDSVITAPFDGLIAELYVEEGETVFQQARLFSILDIQTLEIQFFCSDVELPSFTIGQPLSFIVDAYPDMIFNGSIVTIDPRGDDEYLNFRIISHYVNNDSNVTLFPGMVARIRTDLGNIRNSFFVPVDIVSNAEEGKYVFVAKDNIVHKVFVTIGQQIKDEYVITSGLNENDLVLITGYSSVRDGSKILIVNTQ